MGKAALGGALAVLAGAEMMACGGPSTNGVRSGTTPYSRTIFRARPENPEMPPATTAAGRLWASRPARTGRGHLAAPSTIVHVSIDGVKTPGGTEPAYVGPSGTVGSRILFSVKAHESIEVVVVNHDTGPHTFDAPGLGLHVTIRADATTSFRFDTPGPGTYRWYCDVPCGPWVMSHVGYMKGEVTVVS
ncbi:MAG: cupredoxin domain-containing protein [Actinomycetota bacterium]|nr:cupredoxin domain-containing protein [Actinomycetota bacterium]MDA8357268.1 cupredoxin domain-containing protein [Actinomycetota bacterium]